jgi:hypothetical protein
MWLVTEVMRHEETVALSTEFYFVNVAVSSGAQSTVIVNCGEPAKLKWKVSNRCRGRGA